MAEKKQPSAKHTQMEDQMKYAQAESDLKVDQPRLLTIPQELRDRIYDFAVVAWQDLIRDRNSIDAGYGGQDSGANEAVDTYRALCLTSRQLMREVKPHFFGRNIFAHWVGLAPDAQIFRKIDEHLHLIKHVVFYRHAKYDWGSPLEHLPCILDIRVTFDGLTASVTVANGGTRVARTMTRAVEARYQAIGSFRSAPEETRKLAEQKVKHAIDEFKADLKISGKVTNVALNRLSRAVEYAW